MPQQFYRTCGCVASNSGVLCLKNFAQQGKQNSVVKTKRTTTPEDRSEILHCSGKATHIRRQGMDTRKLPESALRDEAQLLVRLGQENAGGGGQGLASAQAIRLQRLREALVRGDYPHRAAANRFHLQPRCRRHSFATISCV